MIQNSFDSSTSMTLPSAHCEISIPDSVTFFVGYLHIAQILKLFKCLQNAGGQPLYISSTSYCSQFSFTITNKSSVQGPTDVQTKDIITRDYVHNNMPHLTHWCQIFSTMLLQ